MVLSIVESSLAVGVGEEDAVDMVGIEIPETILEDELDSELTLAVVGEGT